MDLLTDGFGHWLAGLMDGEGSFQISPNRPGFVCRANIGLREDDAAVLREIMARTGLGRIVVQPRYGQRKPLSHWRVERRLDCQALVAVFEEFPLRSKKARHFEVWKEAVALIALMTGPVAIGQGRDWSGVAALKERLADARQYRKPVLVSPVEGRAEACS